MDTQDLTRTRYRRLVDRGRLRFGAEDWVDRMGRYDGNPRAFAHDVLGSTWWCAQEDVGRAIVQYRRVAVRSGNGVGKTYLAADLALWFLYTHHPAIVLTSAPTTRQVRHVLWREIRSRFQSACRRLPGRLYRTRLELGAGSFAIGLATDSAEGGVRFQGFHADNLLIILDEASGIPEDIWDAAEGVAVGGNNKILAIGNPLAASGRFHQLFKGARGWHKLTISALDHPNVTSRGRPIPGCVTAAFIDDRIADWCEPADTVPPLPSEERAIGERGTGGEGSDHQPSTLNHQPTAADTLLWNGRRYRPNDLFRARVLGQFPRAEDAALIPLDWIEAAVGRPLPAAGAPRLAADVARFGDDWTIIGLRQGPVLRALWPIKGADTVQVADAVTDLAYAEHPAAIAIDSIGIGAGVVDNLRARGIEGVEAVNVSHAAYDRERFANRRAELYWGLRERFRQGDVSLPADPQLVEELAAVRYRINPRGQIQIEAKEEMKRRLRRSPDRADMMALLFDSSADALALLPQRQRAPTAREQLVAQMSGW